MFLHYSSSLRLKPTNWASVVKSWFDEYKLFDPNEIDSFRTIQDSGHFTQGVRKRPTLQPLSEQNVVQPVHARAMSHSRNAFGTRGFLLLAWMSSRPHDALGGALDDAISKGGHWTELPFYWLEGSQGVLTEDSLSNFTCIAVVSGDVSFSWSLDGHPVDEAFISEPFRVPIDFMGVDLHVSFVSLNGSLLSPDQRTNVTCHIQLMRRIPAAFRLSATVRSGVERLHSGFGDQCRAPEPSSVRVPARACAGEATVCSTRLYGEGLCVCDPHRAVRHEELRACVLRKELGEACLVDEHCDERNQRCYHNHCVCQELFEIHGNTCSQNASLNGICDAFRLCPEGSACTDNLCRCAKGYYNWGGKCQKRLLSERQGKAAVVGILVVSTAVVVLALAALALYFYHHSRQPSLMVERTGSSWDFFPTATTNKRDSLG
ncbi:hypothetical protein HPB50_026251 [Hyalomma asiaticum]|uniref:Uncharacterized protein n=1 Tax=Hyalomma asiaticum TaxID=266040 RepID=A0ACB7SC35_HYAAI|nr:hypothetical protein HPB50_026251 [Hyalomma asiaticum]